MATAHPAAIATLPFDPDSPPERLWTRSLCYCKGDMTNDAMASPVATSSKNHNNSCLFMGCQLIFPDV
ncbi:hypothetical protein GJR93_11055 [Aminobacter sp. MDW-2]|nr:hypothetical protein [Aminobacter sp. MDW-2]